MANAGLRDEEKIRDGIRRADFVRKGRWARIKRGAVVLPRRQGRKNPGSQEAARLTLSYTQRSRRCEFFGPSDYALGAPPTEPPTSTPLPGADITSTHTHTHSHTRRNLLRAASASEKKSCVGIPPPLTSGSE